MPLSAFEEQMLLVLTILEDYNSVKGIVAREFFFISSPTNGAFIVKGTGTRDLIWLEVVSLDRSCFVGLTDDL